MIEVIDNRTCFKAGELPTCKPDRKHNLRINEFNCRQEIQDHPCTNVPNTFENYQSRLNVGEYNFKIYKGTTVDFDVQYVDKDNNPIDLTSYTVRMAAKYDTHAFTPTVTLVDPTNGKMTVSMTALETANIYTYDSNCHNVVPYNYQLDAITSTGVVYRLLHGIIRVIPDAVS